MSGVFGGGAPSMPKVQAQQPSVTAEAVGQQTSDAQKRNKRLAASLLTQEWLADEPNLGKKGLLGE